MRFPRRAESWDRARLPEVPCAGLPRGGDAAALLGNARPLFVTSSTRRGRPTLQAGTWRPAVGVGQRVEDHRPGPGRLGAGSRGPRHLRGSPRAAAAGRWLQTSPQVRSARARRGPGTPGRGACGSLGPALRLGQARPGPWNPDCRSFVHSGTGRSVLPALSRVARPRQRAPPEH